MKNRYLLRTTKKRQNRVSVILIAIVVFLLLIVVSVGKYNIKQKKAEYDKREQVLREQIAEEEERSQEIDEYEKYTKTKKYAEEIAKEQLGLVKDDEIIFKEE
ncbi:MAG: septum formation initiator family protein [Lachnospiraceae bacterium]|nr:septum formation initiator family protein [Candidatus Colinaster scatohippi]